MSLESDLVAWLAAQAELAAVDGRVTRTVGERGTEKPFVVVTRTATDRLRTMRGTTNPVTAQMQMACWGKDAAEAQATGDAVLAALTRLDREIMSALPARTYIGSTRIRGVRPVSDQELHDEEVREDRDLRAFTFRYDE